MDETGLAEANCVLLWKAKKAMERRHLYHFEASCCNVPVQKPSVSAFFTWVGRRCNQLFSSGLGCLQPLLLLGFIASPALLLLLCTHVLHKTHTLTRGLTLQAHTFDYSLKKMLFVLSFHFFPATKPGKCRKNAKSNTQQNQVGKQTEIKAYKLFHTLYLNGWHLHDLLNIL